MVTPGPEQPSHGHEFPPLENSSPSADPNAPVDFPTDPGQPPPAYPGPYDAQPGYPQSGYPPPDYQQPGYPQPVYPQPGYPPAGYPPAGYPPAALPGAPYQQYPGAYPGGYPAYDPYRPARPQGTNGKAIAALVTSLAGLLFCGLPSVVGVVLGVIAMRETKRTGQEGFGLALAGVIVGAIVVVLGLIVVIVYVIGIAAVVSSPNYH